MSQRPGRTHPDHISWTVPDGDYDILGTDSHHKGIWTISRQQGAPPGARYLISRPGFEPIARATVGAAKKAARDLRPSR
jgi:hypothetical protein